MHLVLPLSAIFNNLFSHRFKASIEPAPKFSLVLLANWAIYKVQNLPYHERE